MDFHGLEMASISMGFHVLPWASTVYMLWVFVLHFTPLCWDVLDLTYCKDCHLFWPRWLMNFDPSHSFIRSFVRSFLHSFNQSTNQLLNDAGEDDMFWFAQGTCCQITAWMLWFLRLESASVKSSLAGVCSLQQAHCGCTKPSRKKRCWKHLQPII